MNRFPTSNFPYASQSIPGRSYGQLPSSYSNGNLLCGPSQQQLQQQLSSQPPQMYGEGQGVAHQHQQFYQNGNGVAAASTSSSAALSQAMWERQIQQHQYATQQAGVQNLGNNPGIYGGYLQYQQQQSLVQCPPGGGGGQPFQQGRFQNGTSRQLQQYGMMIQQGQSYYYQGQQGQGQQQLAHHHERQTGTEHYHPYQRGQPGQVQPQPKRTTGFLAQLLENKPVTRTNYPYRYASARGVGMGGPPVSAQGPSTSSLSGMASSYPMGYGSVPQPQSATSASRARFRSAYVAAVPPTPNSNMIRAYQQQNLVANYPMVSRGHPGQQFNGGGMGNGGMVMSPANREGEVLRELLKAKADERFKRNTSLLGTILDEKIVELNPSVVSSQRLSALKNQVNILNGELSKQEEDVHRTQASLDKKMEDFKASNTNYKQSYEEYCKPISKEVYHELIDKYYNKIKEKQPTDDQDSSCDCSDDQDAPNEGEENNSTTEDQVKAPLKERVALSPVTPPPNSAAECADEEENSSSRDLMTIGEIKPKPRQIGNDGWASSGGYPDQFFPGQGQVLDGRHLHHHHQAYQGNMAQMIQQQPQPFGYPQQQLQHYPDMQMGDRPPQPQYGGPQSFTTTHFYEQVSPPPTPQQFPGGSNKMMGYGNGGARFPPVMQRNSIMAQDGGGPGSSQVATSSRAPLPTNFEGVVQQLQRPPRLPGKRPSEELRSFLIKLVKDKCGGSGEEGGGEADQANQVRGGGSLFCGGGIMEVNMGAPVPPPATSISPAIREWIKENLSKDGSIGSASESQEEVNEVVPEGDLNMMEGEVEENRYGLLDEPEDNLQIDESGRKSDTPEIIGNSRSEPAGPSKLAELLEKPLPLCSRTDLNRIEIALDSQLKSPPPPENLSEDDDEEESEEDREPPQNDMELEGSSDRVDCENGTTAQKKESEDDDEEEDEEDE